MSRGRIGKLGYEYTRFVVDRWFPWLEENPNATPEQARNEWERLHRVARGEESEPFYG
jgi:hypothetical protein